MREFFEGFIAYISGPTVVALIIGVLGKTSYDHWLANRRKAREQKLADESEAQSRNIALRSVAIDDIGNRFRDWMSQYENIKNMDQLPLERFAVMQASSFAESVSGLSFMSRNVWSIIKENDTIFSKRDYEQLKKFAQEIMKISNAFEGSLEHYDVGRSMGDQPNLLSRSREAIRQLIQDANRSALPMHGALIERFRELSGTSKN